MQKKNVITPSEKKTGNATTFAQVEISHYTFQRRSVILFVRLFFNVAHPGPALFKFQMSCWKKHDGFYGVRPFIIIYDWPVKDRGEMLMIAGRCSTGAMHSERLRRVFNGHTKRREFTARKSGSSVFLWFVRKAPCTVDDNDERLTFYRHRRRRCVSSIAENQSYPRALPKLRGVVDANRRYGRKQHKKKNRIQSKENYCSRDRDCTGIISV